MRNRKSSTGDKTATRCKYLEDYFIIDPKNHFWENERYTDKAKEYYRNLVSEAMTRYLKRNKSDSIIWK